MWVVIHIALLWNVKGTWKYTYLRGQNIPEIIYYELWPWIRIRII